MIIDDFQVKLFDLLQLYRSCQQKPVILTRWNNGLTKRNSFKGKKNKYILSDL